MATQEDRSLSAGMSIPKWMKSRLSHKLDLDQSTFSPTELDDSFMLYYRNPPPKTATTTTIMTDTTKVIKATPDSTVKADFSNLKPRPKGTDDGFKSEASQVGSSILKVAEHFVSGKSMPDNTPKPVEECEQLLAKFDPYRRRGSRSLPASPLGSPKSQRRVNKYFTSPYVETDKSKGWILSSLLAKRDISQSMRLIGEEETGKELERAASAISVDEVGVNAHHKQHEVFTAKPSELREMNFWSPTSM